MAVPSINVEWEASKRQPGQRIARVRFRYQYVDGGGILQKHRYNKSLGIVDDDEAELARTTIVDTLKRIDRGWPIPNGLSKDRFFDFLLSGGNVQEQPKLVQDTTLDEIQEAYFNSLPSDANEDSTLATKRLHLGHLKRLLGAETPLRTIGASQLQGYIKKREKVVQGVTIGKEIATFRVLWSYARAQNLVDGDFPTIQLPKSKQKPPFQTFDQIERAIKRGGLDEDEQSDLWDCLFLREPECLELLEHVRQHALHDFIVPLVAIPMFTGCRRGEVLRSEVRHWDLEGGYVEIWSKKDKKDVSMSCRVVNILPPLREVMKEWFGRHPGGRWTLMTPANLRRSRTKRQAPEQLTEDQAHDHFKRTLSKSAKWAKVRGMHALRHSFISICALNNVPQPQIDAWVGHSTEEQRRRYRHLYPEAAEQAAHSLRLFNGHSINEDAT